MAIWPCAYPLGDNPVFILSVGGFHPAFKEVPADLKNMRRITISLYDSDSARIIIQTYFAITSNTAQFGAEGRTVCRKKAVSIFMVLSVTMCSLQFSPFKIHCRLRRRCCPPTPFIGDHEHSCIRPTQRTQTLGCKGEASVSFFFFSVSVPFHVTWGDSVDEADKEKVDILALLEEAIQDERNWRAEIPAR